MKMWNGRLTASQTDDAHTEVVGISGTNVGAGCSCHPTVANHHRSPHVPLHPVWQTPVARLPGLNARDVHFMIGSLPLTDGAHPSRDGKTIIARSVDGRIRDYSKGGHHDSAHWCTTKQRTGRCHSSVSQGGCSGSGTYRIAPARRCDKVARTRNGYRCIPRSTARDDAGARALLGNRV